jgi:sulfide:quinone oxidoreductase
VATVGVPKAGVFAEGQARVVAEELIARILSDGDADGYAGQGSCYIEFGQGRVGRVDVDFLGGPKPTGTYHEPSVELVAEKERFGSSRRARWFSL